MDKHLWTKLQQFAVEIDNLQRQVAAAERDRNFGLARVIGGRIRDIETLRDQMLARCAPPAAAD